MARGGVRYCAGRPGYKVTGESLHRVDVRLWAQRGYFADDNERHFSYNWTRRGEQSGSINVQTNRSRVLLTYRISVNDGGWQNHRDHISMSQTACRFGGMRHWFQCPTCGRRCEVLYLRFGRFACRKCNRVAYTSQSGGELDRLTNKMHKLRARIGNGRPKGTHWKTWERLCTQAFDAEAEADQMFAARAVQIFGLKAFA